MQARELRLIGSGLPFGLVDTVSKGLSYRTYRYGPKSLNDLYRRAARASNREVFIQDERRLSKEEILRHAFALGAPSDWIIPHPNWDACWSVIARCVRCAKHALAFHADPVQ